MDVCHPYGLLNPLPLQIVKQGRKEAEEKNSSGKKASTITNESFESAPEGPGLEPLTVVKKRRNRSSQAYSSEEGDKSYRDVGPQTFTPEKSMILDDLHHHHWLTTAADFPAPRPIEGTPTVHRSFSRRSSSYQALRTRRPNLLGKLRSFSNGRVLSSGATCRHHGVESRESSVTSLRSPSPYAPRAFSGNEFDSSLGGSSSDGSYDPDPFMPLIYDGFNAYELRQPSDPSSVQGLDGAVLDPYLLVPHISITPEVNTLLEDGRTMVWAAVEVSGQLCRPFSANYYVGDSYTNSSNRCFLPVHHGEEGLSRYGYLYNVRVEILPSKESAIVELCNDGALSVIGPGSSHLTLAHIRLDAWQPPQMSIHKKTVPDDLIAELEYQLGYVRTEYLVVRLSYCHSGFPSFKDAATTNGVSACQTRIITTSIGTIDRHNPVSAWSPRPTPLPVSDTLFPTIASHWGPIRANEIMLRIVTARSSSRKVANIRRNVNGSGETIEPPERSGTAPPLRVPRRLASLGQNSSEQQGPDPARKIWTEMRRTSTSDCPAYYVSRVNRVPASSTESFLSSPGRSNAKAVERQRQMVREMALRHQRSIGPESLRSLVPSPEAEGLNLDGGKKETPSTAKGVDDNELRISKGRRDGRWSLGDWW
ncbi:hypothetical protein BJ170DRAFT_251449 [Xylariales sp. AK1849]|nr:hypothetical protein BJ170DRAFT_251449 [Xylariales sp. AK1849]